MRNLKFLSFLMFVVLSVGFTACGDDDDDSGSVNASALTGTWETYWVTGYEKIPGEEDIRWDEAVPEVEKDRITFNADGTALDGTYQQTWKLNGNKLTITDETDSETVTVLKLNSIELVIEAYEKETREGGLYELYEKMIFKKVK